MNQDTKALTTLLAGMTPPPAGSPVGALEAAARLYTLPGQHAGLVAPGNIDLAHRPKVTNPDGSVSTVRSISVGFNGRTVLLPTVIGNRVVSDQAAIDAYRRTGKHLGVFKNDKAAEQYAQKLHLEQAAAYTGGP